MSKNVMEISGAQLEELIKKGPVVCDFWASWCGPCRMLAPVLDGIAGELAGRATFVKVDVDANGETAQKYGIMSIPNVIVFKDGVPVGNNLGYAPAPAHRAFVKKYNKDSTTKRGGGAAAAPPFSPFTNAAACDTMKKMHERGKRMAPADGEKIEWLLRALRHGNADALDGIYALLGGRMLALARGIVRNRADAEDVVSESFLKLARGIGGYRPGTNGCAFVMRIVRNTAYDLLRRRKVRAEEDIDAFFHLTDERYRPERMEDALVLEEAVARLAPLERRMIYYRYYLDFTLREIAKETGMSKSAVQRLVVSAEENLRRLLDAGQDKE